MAILTDADRKFLPLAKREVKGFHLATKWYLRGWEPLPYQWAFHQLKIPNTTFIAGIAAGKTTAVTGSYMMDCISTPYFRALNTSVTAKQAELSFDMAMSWIEGNEHLEHLIADISLRPFPVIKFQNFSEWEFRTAGTDARFIRGSEYDRAGFDEAGLDPHGAIVKVLRGRLRGVRPDGSIRMARLDVFTSPTDAPWLRERFDRGWPESPEYDPRRYRSLRVATWDNTRLTEEQVDAMKAEYPPEMIDVEMGGYFPDYGFSMFPSGHVRECVDPSIYDAVYMAVNPDDGKPLRGYALTEDPRHGLTHFELPPTPGAIYIVAGDPGTDGYPKRNAPCVIVADVTRKPYKLVYFWWGTGRGSYTPFLQAYKYAIDKYSPIFRGIDATGPQKAIDELAFENHGIVMDKLNFGTDKAGMLNSLSLDITDHNYRFPAIRGLISQLGNYVSSDDKKIAQDIVMTIAQISYLARFLPAEPLTNVAATQNNYRNRKARTNSNRRR